MYMVDPVFRKALPIWKASIVIRAGDKGRLLHAGQVCYPPLMGAGKMNIAK